MNRNLMVLLFSLPLLAACGDIFVKDISEKQVEMVTPINNVIVKNKEITLVWETLEDAEKYHVVIVSPSLSEIRSYACDSVTEDYKIKVSLPNGTYEWSVQASNSAYESLKSYAKFQISVP